MASPGKRVLIIVQNLPVPFDRRVWLEATSLARVGYQVSVICPKLKGFNRSYERLEDIDIYRYSMPIDASSKLGFMAEFAWAWIRTAILSLKVAWRGRGFDAIHACNPPETYWLLGLVWKSFGKRFLFDHHDLSPEMYAAKFATSSGLLNRALLALERATFATADVALATNESHRRVAIERGRMDPDRVFVVRSGPDLDRFSRYEPDIAWRKGKQHLVAYLGDISRQDGLDVLVRAVRDMAQERDDFHVVVIGGGSAWEDVKAYATDQGVADRMTFTGIVTDEDLCRILSSATVAVDPVPKNAWSDKSTMNKIVEYMYFGLPIVAFDLTETRHSAQSAALLANADSEEAFGKTLTALLDDPEARSQMAEDGRRRLEDHLAWEHSVPPLLTAYETLFDTTPQTGRPASL